MLDFCCCFRGKHAPLVISMQTFEVTTCRPIIWQLQVLILTFLICLIQMTLNQLCEKMNTENNLINTADIFDIFNLFDTDGGLKDLELKNKKITHYCQEGKTFSVLLLHIIKKEHSHIFWKNRRRSKIFIYTVIMSTPSPCSGQTYMYCFCPVCPSVTVTNFVSTVSSVTLLHVPCILDTWLAPYKHGHDLLSGCSWNIAELA